MRKTIVAILASLAMVITMIPLSTVTVSAGTPNNFTLYYNSNDKQLHEGGMDGDAFDATPVTWSGSGSTLTLDGFNFTTTAGEALVVPAGTTINLQNNNSIVSTASSVTDQNGDSIGIMTAPDGTKQDLTFEGNGNLTVSTNTSNNNIAGCYGIRNDNGEIIFNGGGTIKVTGGKATEDSTGILSNGEIIVSSGIVEATGGEVTGARKASYGINVYNSGITVSGGKLTATGGSATQASNGVYTNGNITVSGGELTAIGGSAEGSYGTFTTGDITVSGGKVTATGGDAKDNSFGLFSDGDITVSKGKVIATSGDCTQLTGNNMQEINPNSYSMGVVLGGTIIKGLIIKDGGTVTTTSGKAGKSYGIYTPIFDFENGTVEAKANKDALESVGIFGFETRIRALSIEDTDSVININNIGLTAQGNTVAIYSGFSNMNNNNGANIKDGIYTVGSTNYDGSNPVEYAKANNDSYKYVSTTTKKEPPTPSPADSKNGDRNSDSSADTGDSINLAIPIGLAIAALLAVAALIITRRINRKK